MYKKLAPRIFLTVLSCSAINSVTFADSSTETAATTNSTAQIAKPEPSLESQGLWQDPKTKLIWTRCSLGQEWTGRECTGNAVQLTWKDAKAAAKTVTIAGKNDWRLPTLYELKSLKLRDASNPETEKYPWFYKPDGADGYGWYWSATPYSYFGGTYSWAVDLDIGKADYIDKERNVRIFLVREPENPRDKAI